MLWQAFAQGRESHPAGRWYWHHAHVRPRHDAVVIQYNLAGTILLRDPSGQRTVPPGAFFAFCPGDRVSYGHPDALAEPYRCWWTNLAGAGLSSHLRLLIARHGHVYPLGPGHPLASRFDQLLTQTHPAADTPRTRAAEIIHQFVMNLLEAADDHAAAFHRPVEQAIQHLIQRPLSAGSLKEVAARYRVSREHLSRCFQEQVGEPPHTYLARLRGQRALQLLHTTALPLREIAEQTGHSGPHHLNRRVRDLTGLTPTAYRTAKPT